MNIAPEFMVALALPGRKFILPDTVIRELKEMGVESRSKHVVRHDKHLIRALRLYEDEANRWGVSLIPVEDGDTKYYIENLNELNENLVVPGDEWEPPWIYPDEDDMFLDDSGKYLVALVYVGKPFILPAEVIEDLTNLENQTDTNYFEGKPYMLGYRNDAMGGENMIRHDKTLIRLLKKYEEQLEDLSIYFESVNVDDAYYIHGTETWDEKLHRKSKVVDDPRWITPEVGTTVRPISEPWWEEYFTDDEVRAGIVNLTAQELEDYPHLQAKGP